MDFNHNRKLWLSRSEVETLRSLAAAARVVRRQADKSTLTSDSDEYAKARCATRSATCTIIQQNILISTVDYDPLECRPAFVSLDLNKVDLVHISLRLAVAIDLCQEHSGEGLWTDYTELLERIESFSFPGEMENDNESDSEGSKENECPHVHLSPASELCDAAVQSRMSRPNNLTFVAPSPATRTIGHALSDMSIGGSRTMAISARRSPCSEINFSRPLNAHTSQLFVPPRLPAQPLRPMTPPYVDMDKLSIIVEQDEPTENVNLLQSSSSNEGSSSTSSAKSSDTQSPSETSSSKPLLKRPITGLLLGDETREAWRAQREKQWKRLRKYTAAEPNVDHLRNAGFL